MEDLNFEENMKQQDLFKERSFQSLGGNICYLGVLKCICCFIIFVDFKFQECYMKWEYLVDFVVQKLQGVFFICFICVCFFFFFKVLIIYQCSYGLVVKFILLVVIIIVWFIFFCFDCGKIFGQVVFLRWYCQMYEVCVFFGIFVCIECGQDFVQEVGLY